MLGNLVAPPLVPRELFAASILLLAFPHDADMSMGVFLVILLRTPAGDRTPSHATRSLKSLLLLAMVLLPEEAEVGGGERDVRTF